MEMITFAINADSLIYAQGLGALALWVMASGCVFRYNLGRYLFPFNKKEEE